MNKQEVQVEAITVSQFMQAMSGHEVHGTPAGAAYPVLQQESVPGQELLKQRVRVSFDFDVTCNDHAIRNACADEQSTQYSLALLQSFLVVDKEALLHMMVDTIATQLGYNGPETFIRWFLPQINTQYRSIFSKAIESLSGDIGEHWRELRDDPDDEYKDWFGYCTEEIFECFSAKFVKSSFEVISEDAKETM